MRPRYTYLLLYVIALPVCTFLHAGCSVRPIGGNEPATKAEDCLVFAGPYASPTSITLAVNPIETSGLFGESTPSLSMHAILGPQLYETVFSTDCSGRVVDALAVNVNELDENAGISFELKPNLTFSDGSSVSVSSVVAEWRRALTPVIPIDSIQSFGSRTILVYSKLSSTAIRSLLADPVFAVRSTRETGVVGTGAYRSVSSEVDDTFSLEPVVTGTRPRILVSQTPDDLRDLLPSSVRLGLTTNPSVIDYAAALPGISSVEVAAGATYLLLTRARLETTRQNSGANSLQPVDEAFKEALASVAVRDLAKAYPGGQLRGVPGNCELSRAYFEDGSVELSTPASRLVFERGDMVAMDIAERLAALQQTARVDPGGENIRRLFPGPVPGDKTLVPIGLTKTELRQSLNQGNDAGYVVRLTGSTIAQCLALESLLRSAPWIREGFSASSLFAVPLLQVRQFLIADTVNLPALYVDGNQRVKLHPSFHR